MKKNDPANEGIGASLLLGHAGVYVVAALIYEALGKLQTVVVVAATVVDVQAFTSHSFLHDYRMILFLILADFILRILRVLRMM